MATSQTKLVNYPGFHDLGPETYGHYDEFNTINLTTPAPLYSKSGTLTKESSPGNPLVITSAATQDSDASLLTLYKPLKFQDAKGFYVRSKFLFTEATSTNDVNLFFGFSEETDPDNMIGDSAAGPTADWHGAAFYGLDGETNLRCISSNGTSNTNTVLSATDLNNYSRVAHAISSSSYRDFRIDVRGHSAGNNEVIFSIDGVVVAHHTVATASASQAGPAIVVKPGASAAAQAVKVQFLAWAGTR